MFINIAKHWDMMGVNFRVIEPEPRLFSKSSRVPTLVRSNTSWSDVIHGLLFNVLLIPMALTIRGFSVVLACNNHMLSLLPAVLLSRLRRKPCVVIVHHYDIMDGENLSTSLFGIFKIARRMGYGRLYSLLKAFVIKMAIIMARSCEATICVSEVFTKLFPNSFLSSNGVDLGLIDSVGGREKKYDACFVGRLDLKKGILDLLQVWKIVVSTMPSAKLALVGHDQIRIGKFIRNYGLADNVIYLGALSDKRMYETIKRSRVFITMSTAEGWGIAIAEALACGIPVVCCKIKTLYEQWKNCPYVFFTKPNNIWDAADKVIEVLGSSNVPFLRVRECVKDLNWPNVALVTAEIVENVKKKYSNQ